MQMKRVLLLTLLATLLMPVSAQGAETKFVGGPLTNLDFQGAIINITLSNVPTKGGLYIQQCQEAPSSSARPTLCNKGAELWISTARGASFLPTDAIQFKPTGSYLVDSTKVDCTTSKCGIFLRFDHTVPGDLSEDQFIPLTFKAAADQSQVLPADEITASINGMAVSTRQPATLGYRQSVNVVAISKAGAPLSYRSLSPACALNGVEITPLTGVGECAIAVSSAGNASATAITAILPIRLTLGVHELSGFTLAKRAKANAKIALPKVSNFGESVKYKAKGSCGVKGFTLTIKKGKCVIKASAIGQESKYQGLAQSFQITGR